MLRMRFIKLLLLNSLLIFIVACKQSYEPAAITKSYNYLVVEGYINSNKDSVTTFTLSRTRSLTDSTYDKKPELHALLTVEGELGDRYNLKEQNGGVYSVSNLTLNPASKYRLKINADGKEYVSAYVPVLISPPIDTVTWQQPNDLSIFVDTHDPKNNTHYYRWDYTETWEHHAALETLLGHANGLIFYTDSTNQTFKCWTTLSSTNIVLGSSIQLSQDVINRQPVTLIQAHDDRISVKYSMLLKQYALTEAAFNYWQILQKNTQELGTLFDAQPSQLSGNIVCTSDETQPVIGYICAGTVSSKRIFINHSDVTNWDPPVGTDCQEKRIPQDPNNYLLYSYPDPTFSPYYFTSMPNMIVIEKNVCLNCMEQGGVNKRPSFW